MSKVQDGDVVPLMYFGMPMQAHPAVTSSGLASHRSQDTIWMAWHLSHNKPYHGLAHAKVVGNRLEVTNSGQLLGGNGHALLPGEECPLPSGLLGHRTSQLGTELHEGGTADLKVLLPLLVAPGPQGYMLLPPIDGMLVVLQKVFIHGHPSMASSLGTLELMVQGKQCSLRHLSCSSVMVPCTTMPLSTSWQMGWKRIQNMPT